MEQPQAPDRLWFYAAGGKQTGPVALPVILELVRSGAIGAGTLVWAQGMAEWRLVKDVDELRGVVPGAPPTAPGPIERSAPRNDLSENVGVRMLIPIGRTPWAIVAGYLGLLGLIPLLGLVLAPGGVFCGVMAIRHMKRDPRQHGMGRAITGIVLGIVGTILSISVLFSLINRR
jgi:hypothetical protein